MRRLVVWVIAGLVAAVGRPAIAATENSTALLLYSNGRLLPGNVEADRGLHQTVRAPADRPLMLFYEFLDSPRFGGELRGPRRRVPAREVRVPAAPRGHRGAELFAQVPVVHAGIDRRVLRSMSPLPTDVEIEHSTDIYKSLLKFVELQDFRTNFYIVADSQRRAEFDSKISMSAFAPIKSFVKFWNYDGVLDLHAKVAASQLAEEALL